MPSSQAGGEGEVPLTDEQIDLAFEHVLGIKPREGDRQVVRMLGGTANVLADYIWDHWLGEPETATIAEVEAAVLEAIADR